MSPKAAKKGGSELDALAASLERSFGQNAAKRGGLQKALKAIPTGSLALDYELGTGGWPIGYCVGVFGHRDIGKSTMVGLNAVKNAQAMGLDCVWIALEPFDERWAARHGVDVDALLVAYPETGEQAFSMLHRAITYNADLIIFDSIGSILAESEMIDDGKARMGGQAGLITWGAKKAAILAYKNDACVILLNQVRHKMEAGTRGVQYKQPGGEGLEHSEVIIVQLKRGKERYTIKDSGVDVVIGRQIVAHIVRNKASEGAEGKKALFDFFYTDTEDYPFGIDTESDVVNTAIRAGVIKKSGSWFDAPNGERFNGQKKIGEYLQANPDVLDMVREGVLAAMLERNDKTKLEAVPEEAVSG